MALLHRLSQIRSMPLGLVAAKAGSVLTRRLKGRLMGALMRRQSTYPPSYGLLPLSDLFPALPIPSHMDWLGGRAKAAAAHEFDLLGSGPKRLLSPAAKTDDWRREILIGHHQGTRKRAQIMLSMIESPDYRPIDWHVDFRSGHRWSPRLWHSAAPYGHKAGVDVKVPWELARLQHLPQLALAFGIQPAPKAQSEFCCQVLDFLAANPPGWGVNWICPMDVGIRAANLVLAYALFRAYGAEFDPAFQEELAAALAAHGRHIARNLEYSPDHRGNHYLADLCGLAFIAAALPRSLESDLWLVFCAQQLDCEISRQFLPDGGNFEASTAYHRLSLEMALYAVALILGLPEDRRAAFAEYDARAWGLNPAIAPGPMAWPPVQPQTLDRLAAALGFAQTTRKPSGDMVQIGDNDSGRFFILDPDQSKLDPAHLWAGDNCRMVLTALSAGALPLPAAPAATIVVSGKAEFQPGLHLTIQPPDPSALADLTAFAFPDFGLWGWRNGRCFISVRCGRMADGRGAHAHNDQLAVEIEIDGIAWLRDPGSFTYTADLAERNRYRSAAAHFVPRWGDAEPAALNLGPFRLDDAAQARALHFDGASFLGEHSGFGRPVRRHVRVEDGTIVIEDDCAAQAQSLCVRTPQELTDLFDPPPFSPAYGIRL